MGDIHQTCLSAHGGDQIERKWSYRGEGVELHGEARGAGRQNTGRRVAFWRSKGTSLTVEEQRSEWVPVRGLLGTGGCAFSQGSRRQLGVYCI